MNRADLYQQIQKKQSYLCVGLDPDIKKIPQHLLDYEDPIFEFCKQIIDATKDLAVAYKPNLAFYESLGHKGLETLQKVVEYIPEEIFTIADAKRGDIGNTSKMYARAFFEHMNFDSVTVAPYMGEDSVAPFLEFEDKWVILLGLTSNKGSQDFQFIEDTKGQHLYEEVIRKAQNWGNPDNLMFVIGATHPSKMKKIRDLAPNSYFLVPGVGAQGGDLKAISQYGANDLCGLLVNSSRGIIYAGNGEDFALKSREAASALQRQMATFLSI